jgi:hypothetical protein
LLELFTPQGFTAFLQVIGIGLVLLGTNTIVIVLAAASLIIYSERCPAGRLLQCRAVGSPAGQPVA